MNSYKIVVADSDSACRKIVSDLLKKRGYSVYQAAGSAEVLRVSRSIYPHLVIMDINLQGINAYETAKIIEEDRVSSVIFITNNTNSGFYEKLKVMNIFAYIIKPINSEQLYQTVEFSINNISKVNSLQEKIQHLETELINRKKIDKAKGIVMDRLRVSENEAYKYLRKKSMDMCISMDVLADKIIKKYG
ncbi:ANTAR domain-containing protein [Clostridium sp. P21]|uniref:Stage 0 sporulation protein A homolog n=1 Tax=Clostridium muellerianum TaxID=2716538 RepID=A0A7Y0EEB9_9CLOT|nr:ANTAR domain-containing protein [Clostridium muellerianum]NMM61793.1 ANTAR domain-containing protein [Clostridium muellerianum]